MRSLQEILEMHLNLDLPSRPNLQSINLDV